MDMDDAFKNDVFIRKDHINISLLRKQKETLVEFNRKHKVDDVAGILHLLDYIIDVAVGIKSGDIKSITGMEEVNPFRRNYLFSKEDLKRNRLTSGWRWRLIFRPMLHQITSDGYGVSFKIRKDEIFIFDIEEM